MEIKLIMPEGRSINDFSAKELIDEINQEVEDFKNSAQNNLKVSHTVAPAPKGAGGMPPEAMWLIENFLELWEDEGFRDLFYQFLTFLLGRATALFSRKEKRESMHRVEITIKGEKLNLPNTQSSIDEFVKKIEK